jgi:tetratricopeptide (TPR) repeat protein
VARRRFGSVTGILAALTFLLLMESASASLRILPTTLHTFLVTLFWASLIWAQRGKAAPKTEPASARPVSWPPEDPHVPREDSEPAAQTSPSLVRLIGAGIAVGLLSLAYAPAVLCIPLAAAWIFVRSARRAGDVLRSVMMVLVAALLIAPATIHNWKRGAGLALVQAGSGLTLRLGNMPDSSGVYTLIPGIGARRELMFPDAARLYEKTTGKKPTWEDVDRFFRDQVWQFWRDDPWRAVTLAARKAYWFATGRNYADIYSPAAEIAYGLSRRLSLAAVCLPWLIGPALIGLVLLLRSPVRHAPEWLLLLVPLVVVVVFWYSPRYRDPAAPIVVLAAAYAAQAAVTAERHRPGRLLLVCASGAIFAGLTLVNERSGFDPKDPTNVPINLANSLQQQGKLELTAEKIREALRYKPRERALRVTLGDVLLASGRVDQAVTEYRQAQADNPLDTDLSGRLAAALLHMGQLPEARQVLTQALANQPDNPALLGLLARVEQGEGRSARAVELYLKALALAPGDVATRLAYADLLGWMGRFEDAKREFAAVAKVSPKNYAAFHRLGVINAQLGDMAAARARIEQSLRLHPENAQAWHDLGVLHLKTRSVSEAVRCMEKALQIDPSYQPSITALEKLGRPPASAPTDSQ